MVHRVGGGLGNALPENAAQGATDGGGGRSEGLLADLLAPAESPPLLKRARRPAILSLAPRGSPRPVSPPGNHLGAGPSSGPTPHPPRPQRERLRPGARWAPPSFPLRGLLLRPRPDGCGARVPGVPRVPRVTEWDRAPSRPRRRSRDARGDSRRCPRPRSPLPAPTPVVSDQWPVAR